jgi:hypothetical protein
MLELLSTVLLNIACDLFSFNSAIALAEDRLSLFSDLRLERDTGLRESSLNTEFTSALYIYIYIYYILLIISS